MAFSARGKSNMGGTEISGRSAGTSRTFVGAVVGGVVGSQVGQSLGKAVYDGAEAVGKAVVEGAGGIGKAVANGAEAFVDTIKGSSSEKPSGDDEGNDL